MILLSANNTIIWEMISFQHLLFLKVWAFLIWVKRSDHSDPKFFLLSSNVKFIKRSIQTIMFQVSKQKLSGNNQWSICLFSFNSPTRHAWDTRIIVCRQRASKWERQGNGYHKNLIPFLIQFKRPNKVTQKHFSNF